MLTLLTVLAFVVFFIIAITIDIGFFLLAFSLKTLRLGFKIFFGILGAICSIITFFLLILVILILIV